MRILLQDIAVYKKVRLWDKKNSYGYVELTGADFSQEEGDFPEVETQNLPFTEDLVIATSTIRSTATYFPISSEDFMNLCNSFNSNLFGKPSKRLAFTSLGSNITDYIGAKYLDSVRDCKGYAIVFEDGVFKAVKKKEKEVA